MPYHVAAYFESIDNTANTDINALTDGILSIRSNHFVFRDPTELMWAIAMSATLSRARFSQPSINGITRPYIRPIEQAAVPADLVHIADYSKEPFRFDSDEELAVEATSGICMGSENFTCVVGLVRQPLQAMPAGQIFTLRGTATTTLTANAWTQLSSITWDNQLPNRTFHIVGLAVQSAGCQAARIIFPDSQQVWRPGAVGITSLANEADEMFRKGKMGFSWGTFDGFAMPNIEVLSNVADTTEEIYLDIIPQ
jgi:hypothetical protein